MGSTKGSSNKAPVSEPCPECGRAFSRKDSLLRHLKVHGSNAERGPVHRIVYSKFRACNNCRRSKVRCPGQMPCARCEQLRQKCTYDQKKRSNSQSSTGRPSTTPPDQVDTALPPLESILPPQRSVPHQTGSQSPGNNARTSPPREIENPPQSIGVQPPTPPPSSTATGEQKASSSSSAQALRAALLNNGKPFSAVQSPYVSPTLHMVGSSRPDTGLTVVNILILLLYCIKA